MSFLDALAQLLSSSDLRASLRADPAGTAELLGCARDAERLAQLDLQQLERQARTIASKRAVEIRSLAPNSVASATSSNQRISDYLETHWPAGHRRHVKDALGFLNWIEHRGVRICLKERLRLEVRSGMRSWAFGCGRAVTRRGWRLGLHFVHDQGRSVHALYLG